MSNRRFREYQEAVARAAREARRAKPRGRPVPQNLSEEGRALGFERMQAAPRCKCHTRRGTPCKNPALRGATRCVKHGGRYEVPDHPHNINRFFEGKIRAPEEQRREYKASRAKFDALSYWEQRELIEALPDYASGNFEILCKAAALLEQGLLENARLYHDLLEEARRARMDAG